MTLRFCLGLCLAASLFAGAAPASADTTPTPSLSVPSPATGASAVVDLVRRGDKARIARRWYDAIAAYVEALTAAERAGLPAERIAPILGELGVSELALGKHVDAADHLHRSLEHAEALSPEQKARFGQARTKAAREVVTVYVGVSPPDAALFIDGRPVGSGLAAHVLFTTPGEHTLRAKLAGHDDAVLTFTEEKGARPVYSMHPVRVAPLVSTAPPSPWTPAPDPRPSIAPTLRTAGLITAGVGAVLGIGFTIAGSVVDDRLENRAEILGEQAGFNACNGPKYRAECAGLQSLINARGALDAAAGISFASAAAIGGIALSTFLWADSEKQPAPLRLVPSATAQDAGVTLHGRW